MVPGHGGGSHKSISQAKQKKVGSIKTRNKGESKGKRVSCKTRLKKIEETKKIRRKKKKRRRERQRTNGERRLLKIDVALFARR